MLDKSTNEVLYDLLNAAFSRGEIKTLAFKLFEPIYEDIEGEIKSDALRRIISYAARQGQIPRLIGYVRREVPYQYERHLPAIQLNLRDHYQEIYSITEFDNKESNKGPDIDWPGPSETEEVELQFLLKAEPDFQDLGFLIQAIERANSVCRVVASITREGTGFLVAPDLVLTCYHIIAPTRDDDINLNASNVLLRFGDIRAVGNQDAKRPMIPLALDKPVAKSSPPYELDYALLKLEDGTTKRNRIEPVPYSLEVPYKGMAMNILQHPDRAPLQLAVSGNGVDKVIPERGLVQYSTRALGGASGAPCFNDDWEVMALHHAQRARSLYSIREGIIFQSIYKEIKELLA